MKVLYFEIAAGVGGKNCAWVLGGDAGVRPSIGVRFRGAADIGRRSSRARNRSLCVGFRMPAMREVGADIWGRRPEAAKERTRGLFCEVSPPDYGDLFGGERLLAEAQGAVIGSAASVKAC